MKFSGYIHHIAPRVTFQHMAVLQWLKKVLSFIKMMTLPLALLSPRATRVCCQKEAAGLTSFASRWLHHYITVNSHSRRDFIFIVVWCHRSSVFVFLLHFCIQSLRCLMTTGGKGMTPFFAKRRD